MSKFVNPLSHVIDEKKDKNKINVQGVDVPFEELGLDEIGAIAERFPFMREMFRSGASNEDLLKDVEFTEQDNIDLQVIVIQKALAPSLGDGPDKDDLIASIKRMRKLERQLAMSTIMTASFPDASVSQQDLGNVKKAPVRTPAKAPRKRAPAKKKT